MDETVREDAPAMLKPTLQLKYTPDRKQLKPVVSLFGRYPAEKMSETQKIMRGNWDSACFVAGKIDKTVRENALDQRIFLTTAGKYALEQIILNNGVPGVRLLYRAWKESLRNRSGVASQVHSQDKVNGERISTDERERAKREKCMMLSQAIFILTASSLQLPINRSHQSLPSKR